MGPPTPESCDLPPAVLPADPGFATSSSGMVPVDFDPDGLTIVPCPDCRSTWWAELVLVDERVQLREWHDASCTGWVESASARVPAATSLTSADAVRRGSALVGLYRVPERRGGRW